MKKTICLILIAALLSGMACAETDLWDAFYAIYDGYVPFEEGYENKVEEMVGILEKILEDDSDPYWALCYMIHLLGVDAYKYAEQMDNWHEDPPYDEVLYCLYYSDYLQLYGGLLFTREKVDDETVKSWKEGEARGLEEVLRSTAVLSEHIETLPNDFRQMDRRDKLLYAACIRGLCSVMVYYYDDAVSEEMRQAAFEELIRIGYGSGEAPRSPAMIQAACVWMYRHASLNGDEEMAKRCEEIYSTVSGYAAADDPAMQYVVKFNWVDLMAAWGTDMEVVMP